jgi:hypothetical protein
MKIKKPSIGWVFLLVQVTYLFITYIVTSKPKRISVAAGVVHIIVLLKLFNQTSGIADVLVLLQ